MNDKAIAQMPLYQCHKQVRAIKIKEFQYSDFRGCNEAIPEEEGITPVAVSNDWITRHNAVAGGYLVMYEDGYMSFSPAKAFEAGYTRI